MISKDMHGGQVNVSFLIGRRSECDSDSIFLKQKCIHSQDHKLPFIPATGQRPDLVFPASHPLAAGVGSTLHAAVILQHSTNWYSRKQM